MTTIPPEAPSSPTPPTGPRVTGDEVRDLSRLRRSVTDRKVAGVAGGLARHLDIDPVILRVAFVVLSFFGGAGLIVYAACWILVPEEDDTKAPLGLDDRSRSIALLLVGILGVALVIGRWDWFWVPGPLILVGLVVWLVLSRRNNQRAESALPPYAAPYAPPPAPTYDPTYDAAYDPTAASGHVTPEQRVAPAYSYPPAPAYAAPTYAAPTAPAAPAGPVAPVAPLAPVRPRNPRKRGPILFWFTLALIALAEGVLGMVDLAGVDVPGSAYPALAVGITAVMLLVGSVYGRAGGLILVGFIATIVTIASLGAEKWDGERVTDTPTLASGVQSTYDYDVGEYVLDLTQVADPENLDGQTIEINGDVGDIEVIVPRGMDVVATGHVNGPGDVDLFGIDEGGIDVQRTDSIDGGTDVPTLTIDVELEVGQITVRTDRPFVPAR